jgi:hypothetical protein
MQRDKGNSEMEIATCFEVNFLAREYPANITNFEDL